MKYTWLFDSFIMFRLLLLRETNSYFLSAFFIPGLIFKVVRTKEIIVLLKTSWQFIFCRTIGNIKETVWTNT